MNNFLIGTLLAIVGGVMIISYKNYALQKGWQIGTMFAKDFNFLKLIALLAIVGGFIELFFLEEWYWAIVYFVGCWLVSGGLTALLASQSQMVSILLIVASVVFYFVLNIEMATV